MSAGLLALLWIVGVGASLETPTGHFIENRGQWPTAGSFVHRVDRRQVWSFDSGGFRMVLRPSSDGAPAIGVCLRYRVVGTAQVAPQPQRRAAGLHHDYRGDDPDRWVRNARAYEQLCYPDVVPGVDWVIRRSSRAIEYDFHLERAELADGLVLRIEGADALRLDPLGRLVIETAIGDVIQPLPFTTTVGGAPVDCRYELVGHDQIRFRLLEVDPGWPVVIDPEVIYSSYLGGTALDEVKGVGVRGDGRAAVAGLTQSVDFPVTPGVFDPIFGGGFTDAVVTVIEADGTLVFSSYLGGSLDRDVILDATFDSDGSLLVGGTTFAADFPTTTGAYDTTFEATADPNATDGFVARFSESGDQLLFATLIGGAGNDEVQSITGSANGDWIIAGTAGDDFPIVAGAQASFGGGTSDAFVAELDADGTSLLWSTYLGGSGSDAAFSVLRAGTELVVSGRTDSPDFPVTLGAFDTEWGTGPGSSGDDGFVARLTAADGAVVAATYLGGSAADRVWVSTAATSGRIAVGGRTASADFPAMGNVFATSYLGGSLDGFVTLLSPDLATIVASSYFGGSGRDEVRGIGVDAEGWVAIAGSTDSPDFPASSDAFQFGYGGGDSFGGDAYFARLGPGLRTAAYATYLGGPTAEHAFAMEIDDQGVAVVAGLSFGVGFPTLPGSAQPNYGGGLTDDFVVRIDPTSDVDAEFVRGDANADGQIDIGDGVTMLTYLFASGAIECLAAADFDAGGAIDVADPIALFTWAFLSGPAPASPWPDCGIGTGSVGCRFYPCP